MSRSSLPSVGHLSGALRDAFCEAVDPDDRAELRRLAGLVWSCTDALPSSACYSLDIPAGSTYAQATRYVRANFGA